MAREAVTAWAWPGPIRLRPCADGLINRTYWVEDGETHPIAVLQQLNTSIFGPEVHEDIAAVTSRLREKGVSTPELLRTRSGNLYHAATDASIWRALTVVGNRTIHRIAQRREAFSAGRLVARFHGALDGFSWRFRSLRGNVHDTTAHMDGLRAALAVHTGHRLHGEVARVADRILGAWNRGFPPLRGPTRLIHGDLKISNVRFQDQEAAALIDLDTLQYGLWAVEMGDAMRSWCNPAAEDTDAPRFDLSLFEAALTGYAAGCSPTFQPTDDEWGSLVPGLERICWELAARFARDALEECYFGFDPAHGGRGEHNLLRARGQAALATQVGTHRGEAERIVASVRAGLVRSSS